MPGHAADKAVAHLGALTGIRGLAAWLVVLYHVRLSLVDVLPGWTIAVMGKGYLAVDLFFMLSGFVMWHSYAGRLRGEGLIGAGRFLWRRMARVWPLHLFILALFVAFALTLAATGRNTEHYPFAELPLHAMLMQCWGLTGQLAWNDPAWSISTECAAYLAFPLLVWAARWEKRSSAFLLGLCALLFGALYTLFAVNGLDDLGAQISRLGLWRCLAEFAVGSLLCILWQRWRMVGLAGAGAALVCASALALGIALGLPETAFVPLVFATGLLALAFDQGPVSRFLGKGAAHYLGEISYSTYLAHFLLFILFKLAFVDDSLRLGWAGLGGYLALVFAASVVLYHGVEKPAQAWLNRSSPAWAGRTGAIAAR